MAVFSLRYYIDLLEARAQERDMSPWPINVEPLFTETFQEMVGERANLEEKLTQFVAQKTPDPLSRRFGQYDRPFTGPAIKGFQHCHLAPNVVLIYTLSKRKINLIMVCSHSEVEGKRIKITAKRIAPYNPK